MKIDSVDFFCLSMPVATGAADGSQDALLVRVTAGGHQGWGECEAAPLPSIAGFVAPMSHGACRPVLRFRARRATRRTIFSTPSV
jgi:L-alanine-DL-glutamate epimerase-like enolase superfamily enzyme